MGLWHGFEFLLDEDLKRLFHEAPNVIVTAWARKDIYVPNRFTFEGKQKGDVETTLFYGERGPQKYLEYRRASEKGKLAIGGLALKVIRRFLEASGGATRVYVGVHMDIDRNMLTGNEKIPTEELIRVEDLEVRFSFSTSDYKAEIEILGLNDYCVLVTGITPGVDRWCIYPEEVRYVGFSDEEKAKKLEWLEKALNEYRAL
jgi:hypothetical protein